MWASTEAVRAYLLAEVLEVLDILGIGGWREGGLDLASNLWAETGKKVSHSTNPPHTIGHQTQDFGKDVRSVQPTPA